MTVFAISGHAQHGKDTVANALGNRLLEDGHKVLVTHYADLLKYICRMYFGWNGEKDEQGRHILQYVGTDVVREMRPDFWVDFVIAILEMFGENWDYVIIPDSRFPNEINRLKDYGFDVQHLRVVRPGFENNLTLEQRMHPSETALDDVQPDTTIFNSGTIDDLDIQIATYTKEHIYGKHH